MANRREFLQISAAALGFMAVPPGVLAGMTSNYKGMPFYKVIFDERFKDCRLFAAEARRMGADICAIKDDITELWYGDLRRHLSEKPGMVAGLTTETSAFLLDIFSHDVFHHQVFRGEHRLRNGELISHRFDGPENLTEHSSELQYSYGQWSMELARMFSYYDNSRPTYPRVSINTSNHQEPSTVNLVSWIIAPLSRR